MNIGQALANKGRFGDTMVAHLSPREAMLLKAMGGAGTRNPKTGLPEFFNNADFLASLGTGEGGYEEFLNSLGSNVPDTSVATTTPSVVTAPTNVVDSISGGWYSSPEGGNRDVSQTYTYTPPPTEEVPAPTPVTIVAVPDQVAPSFNPQAYVAANPQATAYADPFAHYITQGKDQGLGWGTGDASSPTYNPQKKYEYQPSEDQTWAVPGLKEEKPGDQLYTGSPELGDMSMYQRGETGKPTTSNYKYFETGTDLYGPGVYTQTEDPTKYYSDMDIDTQKGYTLYTTEDGTMYYQDASGNKYTIDSSGKVSIGDKVYNVRKGDESKKYYGIRTTEELSNPDYEGKYKTFETEPSKVSEWQDIQNGQGWKYRYVDGEIYFAQPGDDVTKEGYTGLTNDEVQNWYTYQGKNYANLNQKAYENEYGTYDPGTYVHKAWAKGADGNYYVPVFTGSDVTMERMLRPGEDSGDSSILGNIAKSLETIVPLIQGLGLGSSLGAIMADLPQSAITAGAGLFEGANTLGGVLSQAGTGIKNAITSIPSRLSDLSWGSLAPSSWKSVAIPAAIGGGVSGLRSDWDIGEILKGAGLGAVGGYALDKLSSLFNSPSGNGGTNPVSPYDATDYGSWQSEDWWAGAGNDPNAVTYEYAPWQSEDYWAWNDPNARSYEYAPWQSEDYWAWEDPNASSYEYAPWQKEEDYWIGNSQNPNDSSYLTEGYGPWQEEDYWWGNDPNANSYEYGPWQQEDYWAGRNPNDNIYEYGPWQQEDYWAGRNPNDNVYEYAPWQSEDYWVQDNPNDVNMVYPFGSIPKWVSSAGSTIAEIAPSILKILGTGGTGGTGATGGSSTSTQYPSGSSSGGAAYTTAEGSSGSATGSAGMEAGLASLKKIAAIQALQDAINKKFSGPLYYT